MNGEQENPYRDKHSQHHVMSPSCLCCTATAAFVVLPSKCPLLQLSTPSAGVHSLQIGHHKSSVQNKQKRRKNRKLLCAAAPPRKDETKSASSFMLFHGGIAFPGPCSVGTVELFV
ncbi:uncharacterized protein LOC144236958 [Crocuta crocuta]